MRFAASKFAAERNGLDTSRIQTIINLTQNALIVTSVSAYLYLFTITVLLIIGFITTFKREPSNQNAGILLALLFWTFFYAAFVGYLNLSGKVVHFPHFFRTAHIATLLFMPISYLYISQAISPRPLRYRDLLHILPLLLFLMDYFPFFIKSGEEKMTFYKQLNPTQLHIAFNEGFFLPPRFHILSRYVLMFGYWFAQFSFIRRTIYAHGSQLKLHNTWNVKWIKWLAGTELLIILPPLFTVLFFSDKFSILLLQICALSAACIQGFFLFSHPEILYEIKGVAVQKTEEGAESEALSNKSPARNEKIGESFVPATIQPVQYLSESTLDRIGEKLTEYMQAEKPWLEIRFGLADLARATKLTPHQVSGFINKRCEMNFYSYINKFRVEYCQEKFNSREYHSKTLEAIANESGFQSRATFVRAFRKITGMTPSEYVHNLKVN